MPSLPRNSPLEALTGTNGCPYPGCVAKTPTANHVHEFSPPRWATAAPDAEAPDTED